MREAANRHSIPHRFPSHAFGKLSDNHLQRDTVEVGAFSGFVVCVHGLILQGDAAVLLAGQRVLNILGRAVRQKDQVRQARRQSAEGYMLRRIGDAQQISGQQCLPFDKIRANGVNQGFPGCCASFSFLICLRSVCP